MPYRCPVCGFTLDFDDMLARHMVNTDTLHEKHREWMDSKSIDWHIYSPYAKMEQQRALIDGLRKVIRIECQIAE